MSSLYVLYAGSTLEIDARRRSAGLFKELIRMFESLKHRMERRKAIRELSRLSDRMLQDIGVERDQIAQVVDGTLDARRSVFRTRQPLTARTPQSADTAIAA